MQLAHQIKLFFTPPGKRRRRYQARQVEEILRGGKSADLGLTTNEVDEVQRAIERLPTTLREPSIRRRYEGFQRYFDVLPRIIFMYHRGVPTPEISGSLSFLATDIGVETVIQITAKLLVEQLNHTPG